MLLELGTNPDIKVSETFMDYYILLNKMLQYLHKLLYDFEIKRKSVKNKDRGFF